MHESNNNLSEKTNCASIVLKMFNELPKFLKVVVALAIFTLIGYGIIINYIKPEPVEPVEVIKPANKEKQNVPKNIDSLKKLEGKNIKNNFESKDKSKQVNVTDNKGTINVN